MKLYWLIAGALVICSVSAGQDSCPECTRLITQAEKYSADGSYRQALYKYNSAKAHCPNKRTKVDDMITMLFEKIEGERKKAQTAEQKTRQLYARLVKAEKDNQKLAQANFDADLRRREADSLRIIADLRSKNTSLFDNISPRAQNKILQHAYWLYTSGRLKEIDSLMAGYNSIYEADKYINAYGYCADANIKNTLPSGLWEKLSAVTHYGFKFTDAYYFAAKEKVEHTTSLFPQDLVEEYRYQINDLIAQINSERWRSLEGYWMPDTLIGLPRSLFYRPCADNGNFIWGYANYDDFRKLQVSFINLSLPDFSMTVDSTIALPDKGSFYDVKASAGNYKYKVARSIHYSLKKNRSEFDNLDYSNQLIFELIDDQGRVITTFEQDTARNFFFSPDGNFVSSWKTRAQLFVYSIKSKKYVPLPNAFPSPTVSFSSDSKIIAYFNTDTRLIYFADISGKVITQIPSKATGIINISNVDFTGADKYLKINNADSICLFDIAANKTIMRFSKSLVDEIVVSPNGKDILITCNSEYKTTDGTEYEYLTLLTDTDLNIRAKLYSDCSYYLFTPGGEYIVGYDENVVMRWKIDDERSKVKEFQTCFSPAELIEKGYVPFKYFSTIDEAATIEKGARKYKEIAEIEKDSLLSVLYYRQAKDLFNRLAVGNAKNIHKERIPFYYDWYSWIDRKLGHTDYYSQFYRQQSAVEIFDRFVNSPDSVYPQQLHYAANGNLLLGNLYDSLKAYNEDFLNQLKKEISLRKRVFEKDPDNSDNIYYYANAFKKLSRVTENIVVQSLADKNYRDAINLFKAHADYLEENLRVLPDSFDLRTSYTEGLAKLASVYLYAFGTRSKEHYYALDSALYYADKGLSESADQLDTIPLLVVKTMIYLLKDNNPGKAKEIYRRVKEEYPEYGAESMAIHLQYLKEADIQNTLNLRRIEEFLKTEHGSN